MVYTDEQLVQQVLAGDQNQYDRLVQKYQTAIYGFVYQWTQNFVEAQDLTQETFLHAYQKLDQLREPARFGGWLRGIATNACLMWRRKQNPCFVLLDAQENEGLVDQHTNGFEDTVLCLCRESVPLVKYRA